MFKDENSKMIDKLKDYVTNKLNGIIFNPVIRYGDTDSVSHVSDSEKNQKN